MRKRVDNLGVSEPEIQRSGSDQIDVSLPDVKNADEARRQVGTTAQLLFYDWEASVVGPDCKANPADPNVTGGASAGAESLGLSQFDAITRASTKCAATNTGKERAGTKYYLVDKQAKRVLAGPDESRADLQREAENKRVKFDPAGVVAVPQGFSVVRAEQSDPKGPSSTKYFVLTDQPVLDGNQIKNPEQNFDNGPGESGAPNVTFDFTGQGASIWKSSRASSPSAARRSRWAPARTRPTSTSRSSSTTSSSRCRRSTGRSTPTASTRRAAHASRAASRSLARRRSRTC